MPLMGLRQWQEKARQHGAWAGFGRQPGSPAGADGFGRPGANRATRSDDSDVVDVQAREVQPSDRQLR
jgi:hypothetical protein